MTKPQDGPRSPRTEPSPAVVLVCEDCDHTWEPSPTELGAGALPRPQCEGPTMTGELIIPKQCEPAGEPAADGRRTRTRELPP